MYNLVLKDMLHLKRYLLMSPLIVVFAMAALHNMSGVVLTASTVAIAYTSMIQACMRDDKNGSDLMLNSLPLRRRDIVLAKYFSIFVYVGVGFVSYVVVWAIMRELGMEVSKTSLMGLVGTLASVVVLSSVYFPLYFKLGYAKSNMFGTLMFFLYFFGQSLVIRLARDLVARTELGDRLSTLVAWVNGMSAWLAPLLLLLLVFVVMFVSYRFSLRFYGSREF